MPRNTGELMKYFSYILRNARRNPIRSILTVASTAICVFLMMILLSFFAIRDDMNSSWRVRDRLVTLNANAFGGMVPISYVEEIARLDGVVAATPFLWFGGKCQEESLPFAQFGVDPAHVFTIRDEFTVSPDELKAFQEARDGCVIGRKLAEDRRLSIGDGLALKGDGYPVDLNLTIRGIYDGPSDRNLRMCLFRWDYFDDAMKRIAPSSGPASARTARIGRTSGNAGMIFIKCKSADMMASLSRKIDELHRNSDHPTRTQTEEAFGRMFEEMLGDLKGIVRAISLAMLFAVLCVTGNAMAMSMRERATEMALLKAIGFGRGRVLFLVIAESLLVAGSGGMIGSIGCKGLCAIVDVSRFTAGFLPFFSIPWIIVLEGLAVSLVTGLISGIQPAVRAANLSVIDGLRRVN
jgi:putative ABC transport system permease protein